MPAATTKTGLIAITKTEWDKLTALIATIPPALAIAKDTDDTSIKDLIGHRAHWIDLFLGWYHDGLAGKPVHFPAEGYKWSDLKAYNSALRARQAGLDWTTARAELTAAHTRLIAFYDSMTDAQLYGGPMQGARNTWTPGRWSEAAGASHYRSAAKYLRQRLRTAPVA